MSQHQAAFTLLSYSRFFPEPEQLSPFLLPSEQFPLPSETAPDGLRHPPSATSIGTTPPLQPSAQKETKP